MTFVFKCRKGHKVTVHDPAEAERLNATACSTCYGPLLLSSVADRG